MPGFNGKGPVGARDWECAWRDGDGEVGAGRGGLPRGGGRGRCRGGRHGMGRGRNREQMWGSDTTPDRQLEFLRSQATRLEQDLVDVRNRIEEIEQRRVSEEGNEAK